PFPIERAVTSTRPRSPSRPIVRRNSTVWPPSGVTGSPWPATATAIKSPTSNEVHMQPVAAAAAADRHQRALVAHRSGKLEQARTLYREILQAHPEDPDALHQLGVIAVQSGEPAAGMELIQRSLRAKPGQAEAHSSLGNALRELKKPDEALACF